MGKKAVAIVLAATLACLCAGRSALSASTVSSLDADTVERLAGFGRLWGLIKFCHPYLATRGIDWDAALIQTLPAVWKARSSEDYRSAVISLSFNAE